MRPPVLPMIGDTTVIPVLAFTEVAPTLRLIGNMIDAGLTVIELTLRSDVAMDTLRAAKTAFGASAKIGMGTILTSEQLAEVVEAGADFGVSPGLTPHLAEAVQGSALPFLPGVANVSQAMQAVEMGFDVVKFFPAAQSGGPAVIKAIGAVLPDLRFCPTGGVNSETARDYLTLPNVACVGSSGLTAWAAADPFDRDLFLSRLIKFDRP